MNDLLHGRLLPRNVGNLQSVCKREAISNVVLVFDKLFYRSVVFGERLEIEKVRCFCYRLIELSIVVEPEKQHPIRTYAGNSICSLEHSVQAVFLLKGFPLLTERVNFRIFTISVDNRKFVPRPLNGFLHDSASNVLPPVPEIIIRKLDAVELWIPEGLIHISQAVESSGVSIRETGRNGRTYRSKSTEEKSTPDLFVLLLLC
jgi:hypothetical protein